MNKKQPSLLSALIPIIVLILLLTCNVIFFDDTLGGANQMALLIGAAVASIITVRLGLNWFKIRDNIISTIGSAMPSMLILLLIGSLSGTWLLSGVVPALIYYGLDILHPRIFLFATVIVCALVSLATGSSWSTVATIGVALLGIGQTLGISKPIVAGAILSGAYFGDKMSPLSDTTNLAPAMAGTDLFTHIRYMMYTTFPTFFITMVIFFIWGFSIEIGESAAKADLVQDAIEGAFNTTPFLLLVPAILIFIIVKKVPPLPSLLAGTLLGGIFAVIFQPQIITEIANTDGSYWKASYISFMQSMFGSISVSTTEASVNDMLTTDGMKGMLDTIWLILSAMVFGGVMESGGLLIRITNTLMRVVKSTGSLVSSTVFSCLFFNLTASDQYIAIVVPGRMFKKAYEDNNLKPEVLSRTLEDSGTVTSVLIPWNTCGATQARVLGVNTIDYLPYCFFNIISPFMTMFFAWFNIKIRRYTKKTPLSDNGEQGDSIEVKS